ncbi:MAG: glycosyltransferase family 2 protein, partial [Deferribacteres bacterium]|nr:glycosyltransferase family 2 protein [Deferribacteres bacterium]
MKRISIVVPVYCEEENIRSLYKRLEGVTKCIKNYRWEYIFVNDGSDDNSFLVLQKLAACDRKVKVINFSRNFGKEIALSAGVAAADTDAVITIDSDLQHPPELIPAMLKKWENGADIVIAARKNIQHPLYRKLGSKLFYWTMNKISQIKMISHTTDFRLIDRKVADVFKTMPERSRIYRGLIDWLGFKTEYVEFNASARENGHSVYSYRKLLGLAINGITSFSAYPLKVAGIIGLLITFFSSTLLMIMFPVRFIFNPVYFSSLSFVVVINTLLTGIVLTCLGLIALYIENIHNEVISRPLY